MVSLAYASIFTSLAMAHMKATSSRAIAVTTMLACLPWEVRRRKRLQSRTCNFQPMSRTDFGKPSMRFWMCGEILAG